MKRFICIWIIVSFTASSFVLPQHSHAQEPLNLPLPGSMVNLSAAYVPVLIKGLKVHPENPLLFDFILDTGKSGLKVNGPEFKNESEKLIKYFGSFVFRANIVGSTDHNADGFSARSIEHLCTHTPFVLNV